ncbi:MAG: hypothetical protein AAB582_01400 [Patescibacteria group bacterium]|mgnify:CR=1 FL=1
MADKGQQVGGEIKKSSQNSADFDTFVLDKGIFSNVFDKDIRRVFIYKKAERLAKAIHLIAPAFRNSQALREKLDMIAIGLVDAAVLPPALARVALSRELLALSSVLSIARAGGLLSVMNADLIGREAHLLLQEVAAYEEPRLILEDGPTLAGLVKSSTMEGRTETKSNTQRQAPVSKGHTSDNKGQRLSDNTSSSTRREVVLDVLKQKGPSYIKDISVVIRDVSEKTIQRELQSLVAEGVVERSGKRRWTTYTLTDKV